MLVEYKKNLKEAGVLEEECKACMEWAFGDGFGSMPIINSHLVWNERHGDIFILFGYENIEEGIKRIGRAYLENKE